MSTCSFFHGVPGDEILVSNSFGRFCGRCFDPITVPCTNLSVAQKAAGGVGVVSTRNPLNGEEETSSPFSLARSMPSQAQVIPFVSDPSAQEFSRVGPVLSEVCNTAGGRNYLMMVEKGKTKRSGKKTRSRVGNGGNPRRSGAVAASQAIFNPAQTFSLGNNLSAFPLRLMRTLRYAQTNRIDVANFGVSSQVFRANSLFDPDFTGTGHQPNGFDQLMVAYNHFTVMRCRIDVRVIQTQSGGGSIEPGAVVLSYSDSGVFMASQADYPTCIEKRNVMATGFYGSSTTTGNAFILRGNLDIPRLLGKTSQQLIDMANLRGNSGANPVEVYFYEIGLFSFSSNPGPIDIVCTLEYDAVFTEPRFNSGDS